MFTNRNTITVKNVKCLFCGSTRLLQEKKEYKSDDKVKCEQCGRFNNYGQLARKNLPQGNRLRDKEIRMQVDRISDEFGKSLEKAVKNSKDITINRIK